MKRLVILAFCITAAVLLAGFKKDNLEKKVNAVLSDLSIANVRIVEGNEGQRMAEVMVIIRKAATGPVTIKYSTRNGSASAGSDYVAAKGSLDFAKGEMMKRIVVPIIGDVTCEQDETIDVVLSNATGITLTDSIGTVTIVNDDCLRNSNSAGGNSSGNSVGTNNNPNVPAYEVRLTYTGYTTFYPDITPCRIRTNGRVVLSGLLRGDESADPDDPVLYIGLLNMEIDMDLCSAVTVEAPGGGYPNCGMTIRGSGPVKIELELDSTGTGYGYIKLNYEPSLGIFLRSVMGGCDRQQMIEEESMVPNETKASIFNGKELPLPTHTLRVGRYVKDEGDGNVAVVEILRKIQ